MKPNKHNSEVLFQKSTIENFFDNIIECEINSLNDFLINTERKRQGSEGKKFSLEESQKLVFKMNSLLDSQHDQPKTQDINIWLNSLAGLGYKKSDLEDLNFNKIFTIVNSNIHELNSSEIKDSINGFARLNFDQKELKLEWKDLFKKINKKINNFTALDSVITLSGLAKLGYNNSEITQDVKNATKKLIGKSIKSLSNLDSRGISSFIHSLAKMEMFEELFEFKEEINSALNSKGIDNLSSESAFSLLQSQMICDMIYGQNFFDQTEIHRISSRYIPEDKKVSEIQKSVTNSLLKNHTFSESSIYNINNKAIREIDICYEIDGKVFFIEVDGPSHYLNYENSNQINNSTKQRDLINESVISQIAKNEPTKEFYYLTVSYQELERVKEGCMTDFLDRKLDSAKRIHAKTELSQFVPDISIDSTEKVSYESEESEVVEDQKLEYIEEKVSKELKSSTQRTLEDIYNELGNAKVKHIKELISEAKKFDKNGQNLLTLSIQKNDQKTTEKLIRYGCNVNVIDNEGNSLLHIATQNNNPEIIQKLIKAGVDEKQKNFQDKIALQLAIEGGVSYLETVKALSSNLKLVKEVLEQTEESSEICKYLKQITDTNTRFVKRLFDSKTNEKQVNVITNLLSKTDLVPEIFERAENEHNNKVIIGLIKADAELPCAREEVLLTAVSRNQIDVVEALIESGIDVNIPDIGYALNSENPNLRIINTLICAEGKLPENINPEQLSNLLELSLIEKAIETSCALINKQANVDNLFEKVISTNSVRLIEELANRGDLNPDSNESREVFKKIAKANNLEIFSKLVELGFDAKLEKKTVKELFNAALVSDDYNSVEYLISKGAKVNEDINYKTSRLSPLFLTIIKGNSEIAELLINNGADVDSKKIAPNFHFSLSPLLLTILEESPIEIAQYLIESKKDPKEKQRLIEGNDKIPLLLYAVDLVRNDIAKLLIENGADIFCSVNCNEENVTPFHKAVDNGCSPEVIQLLIDNGSDINTMISGDSALITSIRHGSCNYDIARTLINSSNIDINIPNENGGTALLSAIVIEDCPEDVATLLIDKGANLNTKLLGKSPLEYSIEYGKNEVSKKLIEKLNIFTHAEISAAIIRGNLEITHEILKSRKITVEGHALEPNSTEEQSLEIAKNLIERLKKKAKNPEKDQKLTEENTESKSPSSSPTKRDNSNEANKLVNSCKNNNSNQL